MKLASSPYAEKALKLVTDLQEQLMNTMNRMPPISDKARFVPVSWLRAEGKFGGGTRLMAQDDVLFNRGSINVSQVQYENDPSRPLNSATAISAIIHPKYPKAPSMHMHISWTEMKDKTGYWRVMADLNPSIVNLLDRDAFRQAIRKATHEQPKDLHDLGIRQGDQYFYIPALKRHRGVVHFYLEKYHSDPKADLVFAQEFGNTVIECYGNIVAQALKTGEPTTPEAKKQQLSYHTLYFLQVLTLDRGTTSGLLVHDENDLGILGSLPSHVDLELLNSWLPLHPPVMAKLLERLISTLPEQNPCLIDDDVKEKIAKLMRQFYREHPEAQDLLARGETLPPTVGNHLGQRSR